MPDLKHQILNLLQERADMSVSDIAEACHSNQMTVWRHIKKMQQSGIIKKQVALLDQKKIGLKITAFMLLRTQDHSEAWFKKLKASIQAMPEVTEFYRMSGETDFMLKAVLPDLDAYQALYTKLTRQITLMDISTSFAFETVKHTTALPLHAFSPSE